MQVKKLFSKLPRCGRDGFSLIELMVVVGILGILAVSVGVNINSSRTRLKTFVFNTKLRFNQARFEAVKRSRNVYLDFDFDTASDIDPASSIDIDNGFTLWVDDNGNTTYEAWSSADPYVDADADGVYDPGEGDLNGNGEWDSGEGDVLIETVDFANQVSVGKPGPEIYCFTCTSPPSGGPGTDSPGSLSAIDDGISAGGDRFLFKPDGDSTAGTAYFYFPSGPATAKTVSSGPWAIIVNTVGRIRVDEWRSTSGWQVN